jgi:hypothetical protein
MKTEVSLLNGGVAPKLNARVDVIVPCYRYGHFLRECVESVTAQPGVDVRILIIDDASPDNSAEIATQLAACDKRISVTRHSINKGHIATYNEGLEWAGGDFVVLLSADDVLTPGSLERATSLLEAHPEMGWIYGRARMTTDPQRETIDNGTRHKPQIVDGLEWIEKICATGWNPVCASTVVVRTDLLKVVGGYRPELPHAGDLEMWLRYAARSSVGILGTEQALQRVHESNMSKGYPGILDILQRQLAFESFFAQCGHLLSAPDRLIEKVRDRLAIDAMHLMLLNASRGRLDQCQPPLKFVFSVSPRQFVRYPLKWFLKSLRR